VCAAYYARNHEIAAQQELYELDTDAFSGKVVEVIGRGIARGELMVDKALVGICLYVKHAQPFKDLFHGNINAFQQIIDGARRQHCFSSSASTHRARKMCPCW
jgi:hypothetical protein